MESTCIIPGHVDNFIESIIPGHVDYFIESIIPAHVDYFSGDLLDFVGGYVEFGQRPHLTDGGREVRQVIVCQIQAAQTVESTADNKNIRNQKKPETFIDRGIISPVEYLEIVVAPVLVWYLLPAYFLLHPYLRNYDACYL